MIFISVTAVVGKLDKSTYGIGPQTQIVAGLSLLFFQTCSCCLILETVLKWFLQGTDGAKPHILLRKNLMNDQMYRTLSVTDDVPFSLASCHLTL